MSIFAQIYINIPSNTFTVFQRPHHVPKALVEMEQPVSTIQVKRAVTPAHVLTVKNWTRATTAWVRQARHYS